MTFKSCATRKQFISEAEPAVITLIGRKTIIDNHVAMEYEYELSDKERWVVDRIKRCKK